jgi:nucleoside 2-deoxyribosyltransferase
MTIPKGDHVATISCYLSIPLGINTGTLRHALADLNVQVSSLEELSPAGSNFASAIQKQMNDADFVCVVLTDQNPNVLFELGLAIGLGRPVIIVAEPRANLLPPVLTSFPIVQSSADNVEALKFHLRIFLENLKRVRSEKKAKSENVIKPRGIGRIPTAAPITGTLRRFTERQALPSTAREFEKLISDALESRRIEFLRGGAFGSVSESVRPDIVAWFPDAPPDIGSPIIIEVKRTENRADIGQAIDQVREYLRVSRLRTALVVFEGAQSDIEIYPASAGYVFAISLNEFLRRVNDGNLLKRLVARRNRFAHLGA